MAPALGRLSFDEGSMQLAFRADHVTCALYLRYIQRKICAEYVTLALAKSHLLCSIVQMSVKRST